MQLHSIGSRCLGCWIRNLSRKRLLARQEQVNIFNFDILNIFVKNSLFQGSCLPTKKPMYCLNIFVKNSFFQGSCLPTKKPMYCSNIFAKVASTRFLTTYKEAYVLFKRICQEWLLSRFLPAYKEAYVLFKHICQSSLYKVSELPCKTPAKKPMKLTIRNFHLTKVFFSD